MAKSKQIETHSPGEIIRARKRHWRVDVQDGNIIHATAVNAVRDKAKIYLPVEEVQPGSLPQPDPKRVGYPQMQDLMLRAFRASMLHSTAPLLSLQRSRAIPVEYQLVPVVMAMEQSPVRMMIADDVGLGKTIEAGLIATELMARGMARRILVICPASLREQWQEALAYFFHLETHIFSRRRRRKLERDLPAGANPWEYHDAFVVSVDYAKKPKIKNQILEVPWDIVIIDEAHKIGKPHQSGPDATVSKERWDFGQELAYSDTIQHFLLLTATPHNGYTDSFASLLRLLDVGIISGPPHDPRIDRVAGKRHVVQRRRDDVAAWHITADRKAFPDRDQDEVKVIPLAEERKAFEAVQRYGDLILEHAREMSTSTTRLNTLAQWTVLHLHKRALSSPEALRQSLRNRREGIQQKLDELIEAEAGLSTEMAKANVLDEDPGELLDEIEVSKRAERFSAGEREALQAELKALDDLQALAGKITKSRDSKLQQLLNNTLRRMLNRRPKAIIFTRYRDTMNYVAEQIRKDSYYQDQDVAVFVLHGGMNEQARHEQFAKFGKAKIAVLVATDAISEGLNLQYYASQVIHYELPWNPNRLEQRNGRVDRFGQPEETVYIRTMVMNETLDATILTVLITKSRTIRDDYGFSPPYFGDTANILDLIHDHGLGTNLVPRQLNLFEEQPRASVQRGDDPHPLLDEKKVAEQIQEESFYGQTNVSLEEVELSLQEVRRTVGSKEEVEAFVRSGLDKLRCTVRENEDGTLRLVLTNPALHLPKLGREIARATFNPKMGLEDHEVEVLDLGHPLVQRLIDTIKQGSFQDDGHAQEESALDYGRTAVIPSPDVSEMTVLYHVLVRFTTDGERPQILEDLATIALPLYGEDPLPKNEAQALLNPEMAALNLTENEKVEVLKEALNREDLEAIVATQIEARRQGLVEERQRWRKEIGEGAGWLRDAAQLTTTSQDLLAVTVLWPA